METKVLHESQSVIMKADVEHKGNHSVKDHDTDWCWAQGDLSIIKIGQGAALGPSSEQDVVVDKDKTCQQEVNGDLLKLARVKDQYNWLMIDKTLTTRDGWLKNRSRDTAEMPTQAYFPWTKARLNDNHVAAYDDSV